MRDWLHGRGFDDATIRANLLGCDPGRQRCAVAGLPYGKVPAATFPAFDPAGRVSFVQARYLDVDAAGRKYDNPSSALARTLASPSPSRPSPRWPLLIVCEGMPGAHRRPGRLPLDRAARRPGPRRDRRRPRRQPCRTPRPRRRADDRRQRRRAHRRDRLADLPAEHVDPVIVEPPADLADADGEPVVDLNAWAQLDPAWSDDLLAALDPDTTPPAPPAPTSSSPPEPTTSSPTVPNRSSISNERSPPTVTPRHYARH